MLSRNNLKLGEVSGPWGPVTDDNGSHNVNKSTTSTAQPAPAEPVEDLLSFGSSSDKPSSSLLSDFEGLSFDAPAPAPARAPAPAPAPAPSHSSVPPGGSSFSFLSGGGPPAAQPAPAPAPVPTSSSFSFLNGGATGSSPAVPAATAGPGVTGAPAPGAQPSQTPAVMRSQADRSAMAVSDLFSLGEELEREKTTQKKPTAFDSLLPFSAQAPRPKQTSSGPPAVRPQYGVAPQVAPFPASGAMGGPPMPHQVPHGVPPGGSPMMGYPTGGVPVRPGYVAGVPPVSAAPAQGGFSPAPGGFSPAPGSFGGAPGMPFAGYSPAPAPVAGRTSSFGSDSGSGFGFLNGSSSASPMAASGGGSSAKPGVMSTGLNSTTSVIDAMSPEAMATWDTSSGVVSSQRQLKLEIPGFGASHTQSKPVRKGPPLNSLAGK